MADARIRATLFLLLSSVSNAAKSEAAKSCSVFEVYPVKNFRRDKTSPASVYARIGRSFAASSPSALFFTFYLHAVARFARRGLAREPILRYTAYPSVSISIYRVCLVYETRRTPSTTQLSRDNHAGSIRLVAGEGRQFRATAAPSISRG